MDDTERDVGWVVLASGHIYGIGSHHTQGAIDNPLPTRERAEGFAILPTDQILTLEEARIWMTLNNL